MSDREFAAYIIETNLRAFLIPFNKVELISLETKAGLRLRVLLSNGSVYQRELGYHVVFDPKALDQEMFQRIVPEIKLYILKSEFQQDLEEIING